MSGIGKEAARSADLWRGSSGGAVFFTLEVEVPPAALQSASAMGKLVVQSGKCTVQSILAELKQLFEKKWDGKVKELEQNVFLVEFPDKNTRKELARFVNGFWFISDTSVHAIVTATEREFDSFGVLTEAWVKLFGLPEWAKLEETVLELAVMVGEPRSVDLASL